MVLVTVVSAILKVNKNMPRKVSANIYTNRHTSNYQQIYTETDMDVDTCM